MKKILLFGLFLFLIQSTQAQITRTASSFSELLTALAASASNDTISLAADITATSSVAISKSVQIKGNDFTLSAVKPGVTALGTLESTTTIYALINITGSGSEVGIQDLVMVGGNYTGYGSALKVAAGTKVNIKNSQVTRSVGVNGGAIYNEGSLSMENVVIRRNYAALGGGIYNKGGGARLFIDNVALVENRTLNLTGSGGAIYNVDGGSVYINNGTLSNNQSNVAGGAVYNGPKSTIYLVNVTATGNVVYNLGSTKGPVVANNGGTVEIINSVLAYNYRSEDYGDTYTLDDLSPVASPAGIKMYYSYYHGPLPLGIGGNVNNIAYGGDKKGTDNSLFSGGILSPVDSIGFEVGMDSIYRPYLFEEGGTVIAPLKFGSELLEAMNGGTSTRFGLSLGETCSGFNTSDFTKNGSAAVVNSNTVRLTLARGNQSGSVWANERIDLNEDFSLDAEIYLGTTDRFGADGIAFVFQPLSVNAGSSGGGLGYAGINPSLAIEYDTWRNSADPTSFDHSSIMLNGNTGRHNDVVPFSSIGNIEDGRWHKVSITWDATSKTLTHVFDGNQLFSTQYDIVANVFGGNPYVYWGFTAATGGAVNLQQVRFNEICSVSENYSPAIAYYDGYGYKNVTGSTQPNQQVTKDQSGETRLEPPVRGAVEKIITNLVSLKVVNDTAESTPLGTFTGGSIYGEVFPAGTRKIVTAVPIDNTTSAFQFWKYLLGGTSDISINPFDNTIQINTIIYPKFKDCNVCCDPIDGGLITENQIIDKGDIPNPLESSKEGEVITGSVEYQWQKSTTSAVEGFSNISGATDEFYSPGELSDTTWYRRMARNNCAGSDYTVSSNVVEIIVNPVFEAPGGGQVSCVNDVVIALGDNCEAIITSDAVTNPTFYNQFIYMDATDIPSSFPLNTITTQDSFYGEGTWMYGLYNNTPDDKGLHQLICWGTFRSQDIDVPTLIGDTIGVADDPSTVIKENLFQQYGGLKEMNFLTWQGDLDYDDGAFQPGNWSCWQSTNHADENFTWPDDEFRTFDTMRIRPSFSGYLSLIAASKINTNESANEATFDPVVAVYADGFDPNNPCENLVSFGESAFIPNPLAGMGFFEGSPGTLSGAQQSLKKIFAPWLLHENPVVRMDIQVQAGKEYVVVVTHRNFDEKVFTREDTELTTGFGFIMDDQDVEVGDTFCIPVKVQDFDSIVSMQMSWKFDGSLLTFNGFDNYASFLDQNDFNTPYSTGIPGEITLNWTDDSIGGPGQTLADNAVLFEMCFTAMADGTPELYLSNTPVPYQVLDSSGVSQQFASQYSTITIGSGVQLDQYRVVDGNFELYFMRNDYDNSGTITDNATDIVFDAEEQLLYDTSFSFFDFLWYDLDQVIMNGGVTVREDEYFGGTISELDLYLGGDGNVQFNGADLSKLGSKWRNIASNLLSKPGRDTAFLDINNLNFGRGSKVAAREFASNLIWNYGYMPMAVENCGAYEVRISDKYVEYGDCGIDLGGYAAQGDGSNVAGIITRTFIINDFSFRANTDTAQIQLIFRNPNLTDLRLPNYTVNIDCDELDGSIVLLDNGLPSPVSTGYPFIPTLTGFVDLTPTNSLRNLGAAYEDKAVVEGCAGNRSFRREWTVYDWCRPGTTVIYNQLIRVGDWTAPEFTENSTTITTSYAADECAGVATIQRGHATDNCGSSFIDITVYRDTLASIDNEVAFASMNANGSFNAVVGSEGVSGTVSENGSISLEHLPSGSYLVRWVVRDECGNRDTTHNTFAVQDQVAPSCVIDDLRSITLSDFGAIGNETEIEGQPERGQAWVTAERLDEGSWDNCGVIADIKVRRMLDEAMTDWADAISFTCEDEGLSILVELKVTDDSDNETICWTNIVPVDKTQPECRDINTVTYYCDELPSGDDLSGTSEVWGQFFDDSLTLVNISKDELCNSNMEVFDTEVNIDQCGYGWVNRYYRVFREIDGKEFADSCRMSLVFSESHQYSITFPADITAECSELADSGVTFEEGGCDLITVSTIDERFNATADECYKIFRTFNVINWCEYEEESISPFEVSRWDWDGDGKEGDGTTVNVNYKEGISHIYTDYQGSGDRDTVLGVGYTTPSSTNVYWESQFPIDLVTPSALIRTRHNYGYYSVVNSTNAPGYFQYTQVLKVYDDEEPTITYTAGQDSFPSFSNAEGCPGDLEISATLEDDCTSEINQVIVTEAYLDANNDAGSESEDFDGDVMSSIEQGDGQVIYTGTALPAGTHRLRLVARDGCGNVRVEDHVFTVYDAKGPAPICIEGFAVELMPMEDGQIGMAEVQAKDFLVNAPIADCSGESGTYYITRLLTEEGVEKTVDEIESATTTSLILGCSDKGAINVAVIATDQSAEQNKDYCITTISVQDNVTPCPEVGELTGIITTEENETVSGVYLQINGTSLEYERMTQADGSFEIGGLTIGDDYSVVPSKNEDLLNGISTFDLVLISKHILGTSLLDSPYKLIAADVNNSGTISTLDLIILRQNLLLQRADFAGNTSWRFVPTTYSFPSPQNPWSASFPEVININDLQGSAQVDFVAIKIGDVNNSAINDVQPRTNNSFVLSIPNLQVEEGKEYEIPLKGNVSSITGFQTGLNWNGLEIISIEALLVQSESFHYIEDEKTVLISWMNNEPAINKLNQASDLMRIKFKANQSGVLHEMITLDQGNLTPEAYDNLGMVEGLNIEFNEMELAEGVTKLMQNLPNPFKQATTLNFFLSEAGQATLTITDITGSVVKTIQGNYQKGMHRVEISKDELTSGGVYYYTLSSGSFVSTRKMVLIE